MKRLIAAAFLTLALTGSAMAQGLSGGEIIKGQQSLFKTIDVFAGCIATSKFLVAYGEVMFLDPKNQRLRKRMGERIKILFARLVTTSNMDPDTTADIYSKLEFATAELLMRRQADFKAQLAMREQGDVEIAKQNLKLLLRDEIARYKLCIGFLVFTKA